RPTELEIQSTASVVQCGLHTGCRHAVTAARATLRSSDKWHPRCDVSSEEAIPIRYSIDRVNPRLLTHADGLVTFPDINAHLDYEQRNRDLDRAELIDARGAKTTVTTDQVRQLVRRAADMLRIVDLGPTAIVTDNDVVYGIARMYSVLAESL